ncbi:hypothetical protein [Taibaiella soli]|uniref:Uncharacterized protein n=1 Tax=Taibaiella soli TaxID=1649169 RepID=A0A2W2B0X1_9BACT|nr:hypothetical protein [Taibaiella soli]PZF73648.1 hypothetical protein DN068_06515 [Taibaiella soli]
MKIFERTLLCLIFFAGITRYFHMRGSTVFLTLFCLILALFYLLFSFALLNEIPLKRIFSKSAYNMISGHRIFSSVLMGISSMIVVFGFLFLAERWNGGPAMGVYGLTAVILMLIINGLVFLVTRDKFYGKLLIRGLLFGAAVFGAYFLF